MYLNSKGKAHTNITLILLYLGESNAIRMHGGHNCYDVFYCQQINKWPSPIDVINPKDILFKIKKWSN